MWRLCVLCVLLSPVSGLSEPSSGDKYVLHNSTVGPGGSQLTSLTSTSKTPTKLQQNGLDRGDSNRTEIFTRPGSDVLLPPRYNPTIDEERQQCDSDITWIYQSVRISRSNYCKISESKNSNISNYKTSLDGNLTLINVTRNNSGIYKVIIYTSRGQQLNHQYILQVQAPVSEALLNVSCRPDGGVDVFCWTDSGDDPRFFIIVNEKNSTSSRTVGDVSKVHVIEASPGPWNIKCSVHNRVSANETKRTQEMCPVPPSDPVLEASCLPSGSRQISCSVDNGTDPIFSLSVNGKLLEEVTNEQKRVNVTLSSPGPWEVHCSVRNRLEEKNINKTYEECPAAPSDPVLETTCHNDSLQISCSVEKGTDPVFFFLYVNRKLLVENVTNEQKSVNVTSMSPGPWEVHCSVRNRQGEKQYNKTYLPCPVPLSAPIINASCQSDGTARVVCEVKEGSNATYTWTVNGKLTRWNTVPNILINAAEFASGAINISCSAENSVSEDAEIFCVAPVSAPLLNAKCLSNGSAVVTCRVLSGTDPKFRLTVNGDAVTLPNSSSSCCGFNYTTSTRGPWNISCSVGNTLGESVANISSYSCSGCWTCLQKSIIGGVVALIVTTSPLLIASFYI